MDKILQNLEHWFFGEGVEFKDAEDKEKYKKRARIEDVVIKYSDQRTLKILREK
jgi:hypothetical protein